MRRRSREQWQQLITEQERSTESQARFCESRGIAVSSLQHWKRKLRRESFVELPVALSDVQAGGSAVIELPGGAVLRFSW